MSSPTYKLNAAIKQLVTSDPNSEEFSQALADLHVAATVLEPYSEEIVEAIVTAKAPNSILTGMKD